LRWPFLLKLISANFVAPCEKRFLIHKWDKKIVGNNLGIIRNELSLTEGKRQLSNLWLEIKDLDERNKDIFELQQMARLANLMIEAAFQRTESRGVQFRSDFDKPDNSWAKAQTLIKG
jgi:succinate dehydrogenase/fumarate reductase flavoprotein subunit